MPIFFLQRIRLNYETSSRFTGFDNSGTCELDRLDYILQLKLFWRFEIGLNWLLFFNFSGADNKRKGLEAKECQNVSGMRYPVLGENSPYESGRGSDDLILRW
ncbi:unnamed protein product [Calypogeia fissa]